MLIQYDSLTNYGKVHSYKLDAVSPLNQSLLGLISLFPKSTYLSNPPPLSKKMVKCALYSIHCAVCSIQYTNGFMF